MMRVAGMQSRQLQRKLSLYCASEVRMALLGARSYSPTTVVLEEAGGDEEAALKKAQKQAVRNRNKEIANEYNRRRAAYDKQVTSLRKEYASEVALQRAQNQAEIDAKRQQDARGKLERQRLKNIKSAQSAVRQKQLREERHLEFQEELKISQLDRDAKNLRFTMARQMVIDELEKEAPLWLTTLEEVEAAFTPAAEQELWARPNGILGAPFPTNDADFWKYETHTWRMTRTYKSRRDIILEQLEEKAYLDANIDPAYWTPARLKYREALEEKAKLRAMVRDAGRRALLLKQQEMLQERHSSDPNSIPSALPAPNVTVLNNYEAMEREGSRVLMNDPTQFFHFDNSASANGERGEDEIMREKTNIYAGPSLGVPLSLKNPIAHSQYEDLPYPITLGTLYKDDTRTDKEKKRQLREEQMLAAAAGISKGDDDGVIDLDETIPEHLRVDYNQEVRYDSDDEWEAGLDPETESHLKKIPAGMRVKESDTEFVAEKLNEHINHVNEQIRVETENARLQLGAARAAGRIVDDFERAPEGSHYYINSNDGISYSMEDLGIDHDNVDDILSSLTEEQLVYMHAIETEAGYAPLSSDELRGKLATIPGMTEAQIEKIVSLEETLASKDEIKKNF